jgi:NADH dehydrogenase
MNIVTGAFGYTGKYITRRLLELGEPVATLTGHPERPNEFGGAVRAFPFRFDRPEEMAQSMAGASVLYNTYWIRFDRGPQTHTQAVENTRALVKAACLAGVRRIVHISITNPDAASSLPYFRGKALLEQAVRESGIPHAIVRPTVLFGGEDILINNIAYLLRRAPVFLIPGSGQYRLQPIAVEDLARIAIDAGHASGDLTLDAVGPEAFSFEQLVRLIARAVTSRAAILRCPPGVALFATGLLGATLGDVVLTHDELVGLMANLLVSRTTPTGSIALSEWLARHASEIGTRYASEVNRHYRQPSGPRA